MGLYDNRRTARRKLFKCGVSARWTAKHSFAGCELTSNNSHVAKSFWLLKNAMLENRNPSKGDPFPQSNFAYDDGTVPTLQEMAQYEEYQKTQDAMESGIPRADNPYSPEYRARMDANSGKAGGTKRPV